MKHVVASYEEILTELAQIRLGWKAYGHNLSATRVGFYEREVRRLIELGPEGRGMLSDAECGRAFLLSVETSELLFASSIALSREHLARSARIADIFSGPEFASKESGNGSNQPRNTLFELTLAAHIEQAGLCAEFGALTDVKTSFRGFSILIEAKRPQTLGKAEANIRRAVKQLAARSEPAPSLRLVAVCIGKMLTNGTHTLRAKTRDSMRARLDKEANDFFATTRRFWENKGHVDGLLVRIAVAGRIDNERRHFYAAPISLFMRPGLTRDCVDLLKNFAQTLELGLPGQDL
jgi:hypothetical protein